MEDFIKELQELCDKHNLYIIGCGNEDDTSLVALNLEKFDWSKRIAFDFNSKQYEQQ